MKELFLSICLLFLIGCATTNVTQAFSTKSLDKDGVVIFSLTKILSKKGENYLSNDFTEVSLRYTDTTSGKTGTITTDTTYGLVSSSSDFKNIKGKLCVIKLKSGQYNFVNWRIRTRGLGGNRYISSKDLKPTPFEVKDGQVIYLGEFNIDMIAQKNFFGVSLVFGGELKRKNSFNRDIKVLQEKYPAIEIHRVKTSL